MSKKITVLLGSLLVVAATGAMASTVSASSTHSFTDDLTVNFVGFPDENYFYNQYTDDNGVSISGASFFTTDAPAVVDISSSNEIERGYPSLQMKYNGDFSLQTCTVTFQDGPMMALNYKSDVAPICAGIVLGPIMQIGLHAYSMTITDSEPSVSA